MARLSRVQALFVRNNLLIGFGAKKFPNVDPKPYGFVAERGERFETNLQRKPFELEW
jgi:hypothetical protein